MLVVVSDTHIGQSSPLGRLADQQRSWVSVCTAAAELGAGVIVAGDVFHARRPGALEMAAFQAGLDILADAGCPLLGIAGNHDVIDRDQPTAFEVACAGYEAHVCRAAEVHRTEDGLVGFLPWSPATGNARETAAALMVAAEDLAERGARILIAHWAIAGGSLPNGLPLLDLPEPLLDPYALSQMFDLVLSGHIHKRQEIAPNVHHIGALSRGNFGEASIETGGWQVSGIDASWFEVADRSFVSIECNLTESTDPTGDLLHDLAYHEMSGAIVRVSWRQRADQTVDTAAILVRLQEQGAHRIDTLAPIIERAQSVRSAGVSEQTDPHESWNTWFRPQMEALGDDLAVRVAAAAHGRIERAS